MPENMESAHTPRQYGGFTPPPGYVQFLVERFALKCNARFAPCVVWVAAATVPININSMGCHHRTGHVLAEQSWEELSHAGLRFGLPDKGGVPIVCSCYGRIIE